MDGIAVQLFNPMEKNSLTQLLTIALFIFFAFWLCILIFFVNDNSIKG